MPREPFGPEWAALDDADKRRRRIEFARSEIAAAAEKPSRDELDDER